MKIFLAKKIYLVENIFVSKKFFGFKNLWSKRLKIGLTLRNVRVSDLPPHKIVGLKSLRTVRNFYQFTVLMLILTLKGTQSLNKNFWYVKDFDPLSTVKVLKNSSDFWKTLKNAFEIQKLVLWGTYLASLTPEMGTSLVSLTPEMGTSLVSLTPEMGTP